jgi:hypothetical protein
MDDSWIHRPREGKRIVARINWLESKSPSRKRKLRQGSPLPQFDFQPLDRSY